jgi:hypothetical protein
MVLFPRRTTWHFRSSDYSRLCGVVCWQLNTFVQVKIKRHQKAHPYHHLVFGPYLFRFNTLRHHPADKQSDQLHILEITCDIENAYKTRRSQWFIFINMDFTYTWHKNPIFLYVAIFIIFNMRVKRFFSPKYVGEYKKCACKYILN